MFSPDVSDSGNNSNKKYVHCLTTFFVLSVLLYALYKFRKYCNTKKAFELKAFKLADQAYIDFSTNKNPKNLEKEKLKKICEYGECFLYYLKNPEKLKISDFGVNENLNKKISTKYRVNYGSLSVSLNTLFDCLYYYFIYFQAKSPYHADYYDKHLKKYFDIYNFVSNFVDGGMFRYIIKDTVNVTGKITSEVSNWANRLPDSSFKEDLKEMLKFYSSLVLVIKNTEGNFNENNYEALICEIKRLLERNIIKLDDEPLEYLKNMFKIETDNKIPINDNTN